MVCVCFMFVCDQHCSCSCNSSGHKKHTHLIHQPSFILRLSLHSHNQSSGEGGLKKERERKREREHPLLQKSEGGGGERASELPEKKRESERDTQRQAEALGRSHYISTVPISSVGSDNNNNLDQRGQQHRHHAGVCRVCGPA